MDYEKCSIFQPVADKESSDFKQLPLPRETDILSTSSFCRRKLAAMFSLSCKRRHQVRVAFTETLIFLYVLVSLLFSAPPDGFIAAAASTTTASTSDRQKSYQHSPNQQSTLPPVGGDVLSLALAKASSGKTQGAARAAQSRSVAQCPSDACRCHVTKNGVTIARCLPTVSRRSLPEIIESRSRDVTTTSVNLAVVYGELKIVRANLTELPADGFSAVRTRMLDLTGNRFRSLLAISPDAFNGQESVLEILVLNDCGLTSVPSLSLTRLLALRELHLDSNSIVSLDAESFWSTSSSLLLTTSQLRQLSLSRNSIARIEPSAFCGLAELDKLNLADNQLESLSNGILSTLVNLTSLDVSRNRLSSLGSRWLDGLDQLKWLEINSNQIRSISVDTFVGASQLRYMRAENNALASIEDGSFRPIGRLEYLSVDLSNVTRLTSSTLAGLRRLKTLNLGELRHSVLPDGLFAPTRRLKYLALADNDHKLQQDTLRPALFGNNFRFHKLNIWLDPIRGCSCKVKWIESFHAVRTYVHGRCPKKARRRPLSCRVGDGVTTTRGRQKTPKDVANIWGRKNGRQMN